MTRTRPTGIERHLGVDDVIVTKTDLKGRITYANEVFCGISAMSEESLLGQPHSVIRHPDMPRSIFRLLWETIEQRREIFAYVLNLGADGAHYWVLAHITPSYDNRGKLVGYHSNRRKPAPAALREIRPLYQQLLAAEAGHRRAIEAADAGSRALTDLLIAHSLSYEELVWDLTNRAAA